MAANDNEAGASSFEEKRREQDEMAAVLADIEAGTSPEWEAVTVARWNNRTVWVRGLTVGERAKLRKDGYRQVTGPDGEQTLEETGELEALLVQMAVYVEIGGKKRRMFKDGAEHRILIKRQISGNTDELVATALRLSGLTAKAKEDAKQGFLRAIPIDGSDTGSPETYA